MLSARSSGDNEVAAGPSDVDLLAVVSPAVGLHTVDLLVIGLLVVG